VRELEDENWYDESFNERRGSQRPSLLRGRIADLMGIAGRPEPFGEAQWVTLTQVRLRLQRRVHSAVWNPILIPRFEVTGCWNPWLFLSGCFCFVDGVKNEDCKRGQFFWVLGREETFASTAGLERSWKSSHPAKKRCFEALCFPETNKSWIWNALWVLLPPILCWENNLAELLAATFSLKQHVSRRRRCLAQEIGFKDSDGRHFKLKATNPDSHAEGKFFYLFLLRCVLRYRFFS